MNPGWSRIVVLCSALAAVALQTRLGSRDYGPLTLLVEAALAMGVVGALVAPGAATAIVLVWAYVAPVAIGVSIGRYHRTFILIWIAAMLGVVLASGVTRGWHLPPRWRWPLVAVALVVAVGWPLVIWRETDFNLALLDNYRVASTSGGVAPPVARSAFSTRRSAPPRPVVVRLPVRALRRSHVSAVRPFRGPAARHQRRAELCAQLLPGIRRSHVLELRRYGRCSAVRRGRCSTRTCRAWSPRSGWPDSSRWREPWRGRQRAIAAGAGVLLAFAAVWSSGSRTALLAALVGAGFALTAAVLQTTPAARRRTGIPVGASAAAAIALLSVLPLPTIGPLERLGQGFTVRAPGDRRGS